MKKRLMILCAASFALVSTANAQTTRNLSLTNTSTVVSSCSIAVTQNMNFGAFDPLNPTTTTAEGAVQVVCTKGTYSVQVGRGANDLSTTTDSRACDRWGCTVTVQCLRQMVNAQRNSAVRYEVYASPTATSALRLLGPSFDNSFGKTDSCSNYPSLSTSYGSLTFNSPGPQVMKIYAKIDAVASSKKMLPGVHSDTMAVSVVF